MKTRSTPTMVPFRVKLAPLRMKLTWSSRGPVARMSPWMVPAVALTVSANTGDRSMSPMMAPPLRLMTVAPVAAVVSMAAAPPRMVPVLTMPPGMEDTTRMPTPAASMVPELAMAPSNAAA
jgi:hypothetical protein